MRSLPRSPMVYGRLFVALAIGLWLALGGEIYLPAAVATLGIVLAGALLLGIAEWRRTRPYRLPDYPISALVADVVVAGLWMIGSATTPRGLAFVLFVVVGALATFRLGARGAALTAGVYLAARSITEVIRVAAGLTSPASQLLGETFITVIALVVLSAVVESFRDEQRRSRRSIARAKVFERAANELSAETDPARILAAIPARVLDLVEAHHATLNVHRAAEFVVVAGAGAGAGIVGLRGPATAGLVGAVVRDRRTVQVADYQDLDDAPAPVTALGLRSAVAIPIVAHGDVAAVLLVARLAIRPFDDDELAALEAFAAHAGTALATSRIIEQARRIEIAGRGVAEATPVEVLERVADEAAGLFNAEFVVSATIDTGLNVVRGIGRAAPLQGAAGAELGPALRELVRTRELVISADYGREYGSRIPAGAVGGQAAVTAGVHAVMIAPIVVNDRVSATVVVGTTDPHR
ncbi:MAG TPA: GAF domain-containing protein, partial [Candidatus Saccharimonadales bacterium]|nr:GAF domain-containing protein [Candidatus Saccharimonadales bacterium]